jgi:hypothetical protein
MCVGGFLQGPVPENTKQGRAEQDCYCGAVSLDAGLSDSMRVFSSLECALVNSDCFKLCWDSENCLRGPDAAPAWQSSVQKRGVEGWRPENTHTHTHTHTHAHTQTHTNTHTHTLFTDAGMHTDTY